MKKPFITVIIPTYNCENFLGQAIDSIITQDQTISFDREIIICDDGSTDNTKEIVSNYTKKYPNNIFYYYQENSGIPGCARNLGIEHMNKNSDYMICLDSDDWLKPDCFYNCLKIFTSKGGSNYFSILFFCESQKGDIVGDINILRGKESMTITYKDCLTGKLDFELGGITASKLFLENKFRYEKDIINESILHFKIRQFCNKQNKNGILINYIGRIYRIGEGIQITKTISPKRFKMNALGNEKIIETVKDDLERFGFNKIHSEYLFRAGINWVMYGERKKGLSFLKDSLKKYFQIKVFILYILSLIFGKNLIVFIYKLYI